MPKLRLALILWFPAQALAAFGVLPDGRLDMKTLSAAYAESEFAKVRDALEGYGKQRGDKATREERIFAFKHLGVIYAADSSTLPRAESYFNRLLDLSPNIELVDMFVSPKIQTVFQKVKEEHRAKAAYKSRYDAFGNPIAVDSMPVIPGPKPRPREEQPRPAKVSEAEKRRTWMWWTAGLFAVGAGVGIYVWSMGDENSPRTRDIDGGLGGGAQ